ncbi:MerR family transcriptional regulator [Enterococcus termitis]|uniref:HTH merR-type domain-containing protein n=1 Tax=Enterococcus termitis TaxID=332950 RepID=A0A1E5GCV5_9ENTE|nr:MerR family transcriptional regulator [Enterococcus termitis]OEG10543.1 hypothetical protein BCR25_08700 [Enterococcus termitis]OJG97539.1 hypothetical protein RV18_GL000820 [Enterococcus termitis]
MKKLTTGELAEIFAISKYKIRHYIDKKLLTPSQNQQNGYYLFDETDIYKLYQIIMFRNIGYSIETIKQLLAGSAILDSLKTAEQQLQTQIDELTVIKKNVHDIIQAQQTYKLNEIIFLEKDTRFFKKAPVEIITDQEIDLLKATRLGFSQLDKISYVRPNHNSFIPCFTSTKEEHDYLFETGIYACKSFIVENEQALTKEMEYFLADSLLHTLSPSAKILLYENVACALAYNDVTVYSVEVKL